MAEYQFSGMCGELDEMMRHWPEKPQAVARIITSKYGAPGEYTSSRLIWNNSSPWKRTVVYRDETQHNFPASHTDVIEQTIDYHVPIERIGDIVTFNGSIMIDRTRGEVSVRCDREEANFLAVNLMNDILHGELSLEEARRVFSDNVKALSEDHISSYTQGLLFKLPSGETADRDVPTLDIEAIDISNLVNRGI